VTAATGAEVQYFPSLALDKQPELHQFRGGWYSKHLRAMDEPSLLAAANDTDSNIYRFLWLRSFHHPIALRLQIQPEGDGVLVLKVLDGAGGYEPETLSIERTLELDSDKVSFFLEGLEELHFWELPGPNTSLGLDGAQWVLEGAHEGRYHVVDRWSPEGGPYRDLCLMLLQFSALEVDEVY
jgi:hypothetical protein